MNKSQKQPSIKIQELGSANEPAEIQIFRILEQLEPAAQNSVMETVIRMIAAKREEEKNNTAEFAERANKIYYQFLDTVQGGWQNGMKGQVSALPLNQMAKSSR